MSSGPGAPASVGVSLQWGRSSSVGCPGQQDKGVPSGPLVPSTIPSGLPIIKRARSRALPLTVSVQAGNIPLLRGFESAIWWVAYSQDGRHLVIGSQDRTVRVWDIPQVQHTLAEAPRQLLAKAERDTGLLPTDDALVPVPPAQFAAMRLKAIALRE
jgi:WD40 repeat protein